MLSFYLLGAKKIFSFLKKVLIVIFLYFLIISIFFNTINHDKSKIIKIKNQQLEKKLTQNCKNCQNKDYNLISNIFSIIVTLPFSAPPASGVYWISYNLNRTNLIPKTYAAYEGIGMAALRPFINIWELFRNISYLILVLILISIGFMIMFRTKINPQTVITIENSLPKIVITLIFITLSFPIAGFLIDIMYLAILIVIQILSPSLTSVLNKNTQEIIGEYLNPSLSFIHFLKVSLVGPEIYNILSEDIKMILTPILNLVIGVFLMKTLQGISLSGKEIGDSFSNIQVFGTGIGNIPKGIGIILDIILFSIFSTFGLPILLGIIFFLSVVFLIFRLFFVLFYDYIQLILLVIFSPIILLLEALPGKQTFSSWVKNIIGNLSGFVIAITIILVSSLIQSIAQTNSQEKFLIWQPPFLSGIEGKPFISLISAGILLITPDIIKLVKELLGAKGLPVNFGVGTFLGSAGLIVGGSATFLQQFSSLASMPIINSILGKIPGVNWLKSKTIPPTMEEIQSRSTIQLLKGLQALAGADAQKSQEIQKIIDEASKAIPQEKRAG